MPYLLILPFFLGILPVVYMAWWSSNEPINVPLFVDHLYVAWGIHSKIVRSAISTEFPFLLGTYGLVACTLFQSQPFYCSLISVNFLADGLLTLVGIAIGLSKLWCFFYHLHPNPVKTHCLSLRF